MATNGINDVTATGFLTSQSVKDLRKSLGNALFTAERDRNGSALASIIRDVITLVDEQTRPQAVEPIAVQSIASVRPITSQTPTAGLVVPYTREEVMAEVERTYGPLDSTFPASWQVMDGTTDDETAGWDGPETAIVAEMFAPDRESMTALVSELAPPVPVAVPEVKATNDIAARDERFVIALGKAIRMSKTDARKFIGKGEMKRWPGWKAWG